MSQLTEEQLEVKRIRARVHYYANREKKLAYRKQHYKDHKEEELNRNKEYRKENKEKIATIDSIKYYKQDPEIRAEKEENITMPIEKK